MNAGRIVISTLCVFAAGAAVGILYAPGKGTTTRRKLLKESSRRVDALKNTASDYVDTLEGGYEGAKEAAVGLTHNIKGAVDALAGSEPEKRTRRA